MALFTNLDLGVVKPLDLKDYKPTIGESMSIAWDAAMEQNPMQILARRQEMAGWEDGLELFDSRTGLDPTVDIDFEDFRLGREVHALPLEEQARQIKDAGLEGQVKPVEGYRQEALDIVMDSKRLENAAGLVSENQGLGGAVAGFGAGLAASFMDPINIASAFVPVAGEARVMSLMAGASGIGQRAAIRAGLGAASGALGAAMIEPMIYLGQQEVQADYTFANSMLNMSFGAIMGGVMHAGGGTFAEWRRARSGKAQPWEYVPPDDDSQALMQAHAEEIARFRQEANPNADPELIRQSALADASLFDSHARNWAYHEKKTVGEYYQQNRPEYRSWRDIETPGWQEAVHDDWRVPGSQIGDKLDDMAWVGPEYAGLTRLNADAMTMPEFLKHMDEWEKRFPEMADYDGIRRKIQEIQVSKAYDWREAVPAEWRSGAKEGEALQDLGWAGPEYAGLKKIDADAMPLPEFLENLKLWEERFPDRFDYAAIRQSIDDVQSGKRITAPDTLFHLDGNGNAISPGENNPRIAKVVDVNPDLLVHKDGTPVNLMSRDDMFKWLRENLQGLIVKIADDGTIQKLTRKELNASLKRRGLEHSQAYANLVELLENALFDSFEKADARHARKVKGQNVYYSAAKIGNDYYTLKIKVDIPLEKGWNKYKDHKISKIEIAPSLYRDSGGNNISGAAQNQSAISGISLSVLKGDVKPSRIENNTLFQSAPSRSIVGRQTQILGANSKEIGRYEVREMDDVIASHDPENQFRRRENYPQEAQERPYHSDEGEQQKVVGNALNYEPAFVVSTDASATNGPPIITQNGIVLGGNSRTMTLQMVYGQHPEKAAAYRQALVDNASQFGIDPQAIANMKRPMLVRVVSGQFSPEDMAKRSREYNQTTTQQLQGEKDPGNLDIPAPKKPGERGALPEATATREPAPLSDPDANLPPELQAEPDAVQSPRGQVQFDAETGRAVVTFFQSADVSTAPHELFHIFRREMERTALAADGSAHAREQWRKACEFVGAKDGQAWSREMEEKFADAGLQYLREGRAPTPGLRGLFERLKSWFMDLYQKAEDLGVEISPQMREVFDGMFTVPYDAADRSFRYAMGDIHSRQVERDFADPATSGGRFAAEDQRLLDAEKSGDAALVDQLMRDAQVRADEAVRRLEQSSPELRGLVDEANLEIAEIDRQIEHNNIRDEFRRQALECQWNGG